MQVLLVDDHPLFNEGVKAMFEAAGGHAVDISSNGLVALELLESRDNYDVVLVDLTMPGMDGLAFLTALSERGVAVPAVLLSATEDIRSIATALQLGSFGFIPKSHGKQELLAAIDHVLAGSVYMPDEIRAQVERLDPEDLSTPSPAEILGLTRRQMEVLTLLGAGKSNKEIARSLFLSLHTVKYHVSALFSLLNASNRTDCVARAIASGLISE